MKSPYTISLTAVCSLGVLFAGCATTGEKAENAPKSSAATGQFATKYKADDGRTIEIGKNSNSDGGLSFKDPHLEKCWIAQGFTFNGYDTLYITPTTSTAKIHDDEQRILDWAKQTLPTEFASYITRKGVFASVVASEAAIKPGAKVLKMENTIIEYSKGGGGARYWAGLYGAGQPVLRVQGKITDGDKTVFSFEARRSGASAGGRMVGGVMKDEDVQIEDIRSMSIDLSDFMAAIAGKYQAK